MFQLQFFLFLLVSIHNVVASNVNIVKDDIELEHFAWRDLPEFEAERKVENSKNRESDGDVTVEKIDGAQDSEKRNFEYERIPTNAPLYWIQTHMGLYLAESKNGRVYGNSDRTSTDTKFRVLIYSASVVRLQNVQSQHYVAISCKTGDVYLTTQLTGESLLKHHQQDNGWDTFRSRSCVSSQKNVNSVGWYLGIRKDGRSKNAKKTKSSDKGAQFLLV